MPPDLTLRPSALSWPRGAAAAQSGVATAALSSRAASRLSSVSATASQPVLQNARIPGGGGGSGVLPGRHRGALLVRALRHSNPKKRRLGGPRGKTAQPPAPVANRLSKVRCCAFLLAHAMFRPACERTM